MSKLILFSSDKCPDCPPVIEKLNNENIEFENVNITESMENLKRFLKYRDSDPYFEDIKQNNRVGVPTLMKEDGTFLNPEEIEDFTHLK